MGRDIKKAEFKVKTDTKRAEAEKALDIANADQEKTLRVKQAEAERQKKVIEADAAKPQAIVVYCSDSRFQRAFREFVGNELHLEDVARPGGSRIAD
jgi:hypothetical protein